VDNAPRALDRRGCTDTPRELPCWEGERQAVVRTS